MSAQVVLVEHAVEINSATHYTMPGRLYTAPNIRNFNSKIWAKTYNLTIKFQISIKIEIQISTDGYQVYID